MAKERVDRLNSLLKEVISETIRRDVRNPDVHELLTITRVEVSKDLRHAKVYFSVIGSDKEKHDTLEALNRAAGFIALNSSKKVVMRYFPDLRFKLDDGVDKHMRIEELLKSIESERENRADEENDESVSHE